MREEERQWDLDLREDVQGRQRREDTRGAVGGRKMDQRPQEKGTESPRENLSGLRLMQLALSQREPWEGERQTRGPRRRGRRARGRTSGDSGSCSGPCLRGCLGSGFPLQEAREAAFVKGLFTFVHWRRKWQPAPVFLPGESQGRGSLVGCCLWGRTESDTTEAT